MFRLVGGTLHFFPMFWSLGLIQNNPSHIWLILFLRHHVCVKCILYKPLKKNVCMITMRSIPWGCAFFSFKGWSLWGCANLWVNNVLPVTGVPFQIEGGWVSLKGAILFRKNVLLSNTKGNWDNVLFGEWSLFLQMNEMHFRKDKDLICFKEMVLLAKYRIASFFERSVTLLSLKEMVLPSNIDNNGALMGLLLL